jgi:hypothetical protein
VLFAADHAKTALKIRSRQIIGQLLQFPIVTAQINHDCIFGITGIFASKNNAPIESSSFDRI